MTTWHWTPVTQGNASGSVLGGAKRRNESPRGSQESMGIVVSWMVDLHGCPIFLGIHKDLVYVFMLDDG